MTHLKESNFKNKQWLAEALDWARSKLSVSGFKLIGEPVQFHIRDWSTVIRLPTDQQNFYFKAGAESQHFEAAFLNLLSQKRPNYLLKPLAIDTDRGWFLLPDGGQSLRVFEGGKIDPSNWKKMLGDFAQMQIDLSEIAKEFLPTGLPDLRLGRLGEAYEQILNAKEILINESQESLNKREYEKLKYLQAPFIEMLDELNTYPIPNSIDHGDLHDGNVFVNEEQMTFFDWGDASLSHPFTSLMIPLRVLGNYLDIEPENHPDLLWARQAYLEPWTDFMSMERLYKAWDLALHIGRLHRSISWYKLAKISRQKNNFNYDGHFSGWVREFIYHPDLPPENIRE